MRCFFMRGGHIEAVEILESAADDEAAVRQAMALFAERRKLGYEAIEVWDRARRVHRFPPVEDKPHDAGRPDPRNRPAT